MLLANWNTRRGVGRLVTHTNKIERLQKHAWISKRAVNATSQDFYDQHFKSEAILSFYNQSKETMIAPEFIGEVRNEFAEALTGSVEKLVVLGCHYLPSDQHVWGPIKRFTGEIFWCGEDVSAKEFGTSKFTYMSPHFDTSVEPIRLALGGGSVS